MQQEKFQTWRLIAHERGGWEVVGTGGSIGNVRCVFGTAKKKKEFSNPLPQKFVFEGS
jgi:hypothetical protein